MLVAPCPTRSERRSRLDPQPHRGRAGRVDRHRCRRAGPGGGARAHRLLARRHVELGQPGGGLRGPSSTATASPSASTGSCAASTAEPLDPTAAIRLLPNAAEPTYATDPPSSGVFIVGAAVGPTPSAPLSRPVQVGLLAQGKVLIQYNVVAAGGRRRRPAGRWPATTSSWRRTRPWPRRSSPPPGGCARPATQLDLSALRQFATVNANRAPDANASTTTTARLSPHRPGVGASRPAALR